MTAVHTRKSAHAFFTARKHEALFKVWIHYDFTSHSLHPHLWIIPRIHILVFGRFKLFYLPTSLVWCIVSIVHKLIIMPKEIQVCAQNFSFCRFPPFTFFPIKLPCGNCLKYWRNSRWNSLQVQTTVLLWHCIRHRNSAHLYCIRQRNSALLYCIGGLQAENVLSILEQCIALAI